MTGKSNCSSFDNAALRSRGDPLHVTFIEPIRQYPSPPMQLDDLKDMQWQKET